MIHPLDVIRRKRDGLTLSPEEIQLFLSAVVHRDPPVTDAQIAAFLMAIFQRGLDPGELHALTQAMRFSGEVFDASSLGTFTVDKHSTGGVGDKTSILLAPILAAAGLASPTPQGIPGICVPMISGRSLGHTGGTLDKLESIPGFDTQLSLARFEQVLRQCGAALIGQTPTLVPADRILYALRDHTGTVESPYLIASSIMGKKLAESLNALVLDVKTGSGAFMKTDEDARHLARLLVETGEAAGTRTIALLTRMDQPLGRYSGNWIEVLECLDLMRARTEAARHPMSRDLIELTNTLAGWMLFLAGAAASVEAGMQMANDLLLNGHAFQAFQAIVEAQGGDKDVLRNPFSFHKPVATRQLLAQRSGYLSSVDCTAAGWAVQRLGAGRAKPGDPVIAHAGLEVHCKLGDHIAAGQPLLTLFTEDASLLTESEAMLETAYTIEETPPIRRPLIQEIIQQMI